MLTRPRLGKLKSEEAPPPVAGWTVDEAPTTSTEGFPYLFRSASGCIRQMNFSSEALVLGEPDNQKSGCVVGTTFGITHSLDLLSPRNHLAPSSLREASLSLPPPQPPALSVQGETELPG